MINAVLLLFEALVFCCFTVKKAMSFTRVVQETFGGEPSSTGSTASSDESMSSRVIIGLQLNRSTWDKAVGALGVAAAVGSFDCLKHK